MTSRWRTGTAPAGLQAAAPAYPGGRTRPTPTVFSY